MCKDCEKGWKNYMKIRTPAIQQYSKEEGIAFEKYRKKTKKAFIEYFKISHQCKDNTTPEEAFDWHCENIRRKKKLGDKTERTCFHCGSTDNPTWSESLRNYVCIECRNKSENGEWI